VIGVHSQISDDAGGVISAVLLPLLKSVVADLSLYDWESDVRLKKPFAKTVIYEMHVRGFTRNPN